MNKSDFSWALVCLALGLLIPGQVLAQDDEQHLARVSLLPYSDMTESKDFDWMPDSLAAAIDSSMHEKFEYEKVAQKFLEKESGKLIVKHMIIPLANIKKIVKQTKSDIIVYGHFTYDKQKKVVKIYTGIYLSYASKNISLAPITNKVDNTIFKATDRVAGDIVEKIKKIALKLQAQEEKRQNKKIDKSGQKTKILKAKENQGFRAKKWEAGLTSGYHQGLNYFSGAGPIFGIFFNWQFSRSFYLGSSFNFTSLTQEINKTSGNVTTDELTKINVGISTINFGYANNLLKNLRFFAELNVGYYFGGLEIEYILSREATDSVEGARFEENSVDDGLKNPVVRLKTGLKYLFFDFLAIGLGLHLNYLYDSDDIPTLGGELHASYAF